MKDLVEYLGSNPHDYNQGVKLYEKYSGRDKYLKYFIGNPTEDINSPQFKLLIQRLKNRHRIIVQNNVEIEPEKQLVQVPKTPIGIRKLTIPETTDPQHIDIDDKELPDDIKMLKHQNKALHLEIAGCHGAMKSAKTNDERKFHLNRALDLQLQKDTNWSIINDYLKSNNIDAQKPTESDNIKKRITTVTKYINRYKKEISQINDPDALERKKLKLTAFRQELKELKKKIRG